jgi:hypothetical protein
VLLSIFAACGKTERDPVDDAVPPVASRAEPQSRDALSAETVRALLAAPHTELVGDPGAAEREIIGIGEREITDDELLALPGSHGGAIPSDKKRVEIPDGATSVGAPESGTLEHGIELPHDPILYTRRDATRSYATTQTLRTIQTAFVALRTEQGVHAEVVIGDISLPKGGPFAPHVSHTSGRDIDIRLVLAAGVDRTTLPFAPENVDWDATWALVQSFLETGHVTYVFLDFDQQAHLRGAAARAGVHERVLDRWFQFPDAGRFEAIVRHEPGHRAHLHIRLDCNGQGPRCHGA